MSHICSASIAPRSARRLASQVVRRNFAVSGRRKTNSPPRSERVSEESPSEQGGKLSSGVKDVPGPVSNSDFLNHVYAQTQGKEPVIFRSQIQSDAGLPETPAVLSPALGKWFTHSAQGADLSPYLKQHATHILPYELILPFGPDLSSPQNANISNFLSWLSHSDDPLHQSLKSLLEYHISLLPQTKPNQPTPDTRFIHFEAPLALLLAGLQFNHSLSPPNPPFSRLYIAQSSLDSLPPSLRADLPIPSAVSQNGRGDLYASSIWLGLQPTNTPWHRDPNPNLFGQLYGSKVVRLMPPKQGVRLFNRVQAALGRPGASYKIRGMEMMQGREWQAWEEAVWGEGKEGEKREEEGMMAEVALRPRDVLYIPDEWWHSVRSEGVEGGLNASVNWWFRRRRGVSRAGSRR